VILHGTFTFVQDKEAGRILALIPDLEHHVCRAGSWLAETELPGQHQYELTGVHSGDGAFDPALNLMVKVRKRPDKPHPRATMRFPLPKQIKSLRVADVPRSSILHPEELAVDSDTQHMATVQVFTYEFDDENNLFLKADRGDGHYWEPVVTKNDDGLHHVNLHIFSAEDHFEGPSNAIADFKKCAELLGSDLELTRSLRAGPIENDNVLPDGVAPEETEDLAPRTLRLARLGRLVTQGGDANVAWRANDALDDNPAACGPLVG